MPIVYESQFCKQLKIDKSTCGRWRAAGHLSLGPAGFFPVAEVDRFLASRTNCSYSAPPTWLGISSGNQTLITSQQAREMFGFRNHPQLLAFCAAEDVPYLKFPGKAATLRFVAEALSEALMQVEPSISLQLALRATGYASSRLFFGATGLAPVRNPFASRKQTVFVSEQGLRAYLRKVLPEWIDVDDWIDDCDMSEQPLVPLKEAARNLGISHKSALEELQSRRALFVRRRVSHGRMGAFVSPLWLLEQHEYDRPLMPTEIARIFDVTPGAVRLWMADGLIHCPIASHAHRSEDCYLWRSCWLAFLLDHTTVTNKRLIWSFLAYRLGSRQPSKLLRPVDVARVLGCGSTTALSRLQHGKIWSIQTPRGVRHTTPGWVRRFDRSS